MEKKNNKKLLTIGLVVLAVLVIAFVSIWFATRPDTTAGGKTITVTEASATKGAASNASRRMKSTCAAPWNRNRW